jgi:hypothetical protein
MSNIPVVRHESRAFSGMQSGFDPHDLAEGGMQYQNNMTTVIPGQLTARRGYALQLFTTGSTTAGSPVISMYNFQAAHAACLVYHTSTGEIRSGQL